MPAMAVMRSLTSAAAALLDPLCKPGAKTCGKSGVGEIAPGKHADLVAVAGDPLEDITRWNLSLWLPLVTSRWPAIRSRTSPSSSG